MFRDMNGKEDIRLDSIKEYVTGSGDSLKMNEGCLAGEMLPTLQEKNEASKRARISGWSWCILCPQSSIRSSRTFEKHASRSL